jgi:hypothetical protein
MADVTVMADGAFDQNGKSSAFECRAWSAATSSGARRRSSPAVTPVRSFRASGVSLPRESIPARSTCRNSRDHDAGHIEAATTNRGTPPEIYEQQRSDDRGHRNRRVECFSAHSKKAWLSRMKNAVHFESISPIVNIAYSFDRLLEAKLTQAYGILVPCRERPLDVRGREFDHEKILRNSMGSCWIGRTHPVCVQAAHGQSLAVSNGNRHVSFERGHGPSLGLWFP